MESSSRSLDLESLIYPQSRLSNPTEEENVPLERTQTDLIEQLCALFRHVENVEPSIDQNHHPPPARLKE